jgi:UDP-galactose transporter B1
MLFPIVLSTVTPVKSTDGKVSNQLYAACSLTYLLAMVTSNMSLRWVSYPTQVRSSLKPKLMSMSLESFMILNNQKLVCIFKVIGKSCKPIPVMILGVLVGGRSYTLRKYMFILIIVFGVALFMYNPNKGGSAASSSGLGIGELMLVSLV